MIGNGIFCALFVCLTAEPAPVPKLEVPHPLVGYYHVQGGNDDGSTYEGVVVVDRLPSGRLFVRWMLRGQPVYQGLGDVEEDRLWIGYSAGGVVGLVRYKVLAKDGKPHLVCDRGGKEEWEFLRRLAK